LCGRGGGINRHFGNIIYRRVVEYNKKVYKQVPKRHRMLVSRSIVQAIINSGGRFLQEYKITTTSNNGKQGDDIPHENASTTTSTTTSRWTQIPLRRAVQKTSQALRERSDDHHDISKTTTNSDDVKDDDYDTPTDHSDHVGQC
jgi:hypothetical protein